MPVAVADCRHFFWLIQNPGIKNHRLFYSESLTFESRGHALKKPHEIKGGAETPDGPGEA